MLEHRPVGGCELVDVGAVHISRAERIESRRALHTLLPCERAELLRLLPHRGGRLAGRLPEALDLGVGAPKGEVERLGVGVVVGGLQGDVAERGIVRLRHPGLALVARVQRRIVELAPDAPTAHAVEKLLLVVVFERVAVLRAQVVGALLEIGKSVDGVLALRVAIGRVQRAEGGRELVGVEVIHRRLVVLFLELLAVGDERFLRVREAAGSLAQCPADEVRLGRGAHARPAARPAGLHLALVFGDRNARHQPAPPWFVLMRSPPR